MAAFTETEISEALHVVTWSLANCEKAQPKLRAGSAQHSLSRNRIKALHIAESLLKNDGSIRVYPAEELELALPQLASIRSKNTHAREKHAEDSVWYRRMTPAIEAMRVCETLLCNEIQHRQSHP